MPALLTRTSIPPHCRFDRLHAGGDLAEVGHVHRHRHGVFAQRRGGLFGLVRQPVGHRHLRPFRHIGFADRAADPARAPGHQGDLAVKAFHSSLQSFAVETVKMLGIAASGYTVSP